MNGQFLVQTTAGFDRTLKKLAAKHPDLLEHLAAALPVLAADPHNVSRAHQIKKLVNAEIGEYRLRSGRWRFLYDIEGRTVSLLHCSLRREDTYR